MSANEKILVVSNRLPIVVRETGQGLQMQPASGGLVTALTAALKNKDITWIGWAGLSRDEAEVSALLDKTGRDRCRFIPVSLTAEEEAKFYYGFSNEIVWPLFHDLQSRCNFDPSYWGAYLCVNRKFAAAVRANLQGHECVWVHDYHLLMTAQQLREAGVGNSLAYFHHIPFPSPDIFAKLPWRAELLRAMLHYNVVGFQTGRDLQNFVRCLRRFLPNQVRVTGNRKEARIESSHGSSFAGAFPIGIDYHEFADQAATDEVVKLRNSLRENIKGTHRLLGVDRLDYTKGIPERLKAFELLLEQTRELHERITLIQIVVPSRADIPRYQELRLEVERLVASINGRFTRNGWVPIQYVYRSLSRTELLAHYRAASIALITPLKDGMNLVAKEFCAAQVDNEGVLILSEFAGAAAQLKNGAFLVNSNDIEAVAAAIRNSLMLSRHERQLRMRTLRRSIARENVKAWASAFLNAVEENDRELVTRACAISA